LYIINEERILGDPALKPEKYRYNVIASLAWIVFGVAIGSAHTLMNAFSLFGYTRWGFSHPDRRYRSSICLQIFLNLSDIHPPSITLWSFIHPSV